MSRNRTFARPYAKAVFELAESEQALAEWSDMLALAACVAVDPQFSSLLKNPHFSQEAQVELFLALGKGMFIPKMEAFIRLLGHFKRLGVLPDIASMYEEMKAHAERVITVELTSALPLEKDQQNDFIQKLKSRMHCNILLECAVDKNIIGGAIIRAGDMVIDGSIRGRLNKLADSVGVLN